MEPGRLGWQQGLATWHQGGWDGNRAWPHINQDDWDGNRVCPHGSKEAGVATGPSHMAPVRLKLQQGLAKWPQGGWVATGPGHIGQGW